MSKKAQPVIISYLRFSRPEQLKGDSIRRQLTLGEEWAAKRGLKIAESFRDQGVSAFRGKNAAEGNLSRFLALVDAGKVPPGSVLLIEQLDRLSRNALLEALELFLSIIRRDIKIVTLMDGMEYDRESLNRGMQQLLYSLMQMSLAHEESAKKSERLSHAWVGKRLKINEKPLTRQVPAWLKVEGGKIKIDNEKAPVVRRIVRLALDGHGLNAITKKMNAEFSGISRVPYLNRSYVFKILHSRALIGEFQPHKLTYNNGKRVRIPLGDLLRTYYPPLITQAEFYAVQKQLASRQTTGGRQLQFVNLFLGILHSAEDGSRMQINDKGYGRRYTSSAALLGRKGASNTIGFPVEVFERAVLLQLHDLILPHLSKNEGDDTQIEADAMSARIDEVDRKIDQTQTAMLSSDSMNTASVVTLLSKLDTQRKKMLAQLTTLQSEIAARATTDLGQAHERLGELVAYFRTGKDVMTDDERTEVRNIIRQLIDRIEVKCERNSRIYLADVAITMRDGAAIKFFVTATQKNRLKRDEKGHPIKGGASGPPQYSIGIGEARWVAVPNIASTVVRLASPIGLGRIDVPVKR